MKICVRLYLNMNAGWGDERMISKRRKAFWACSIVITLLSMSSIIIPICYAESITHVYDDMNRLTRVEYENGKIIDYTYDEVGNQTVKSVYTAAPTATLSQSTSSTAPDTTFTLTWGSTNATACAIDKSVNGGSWMTASGCTSTATSGTCTTNPGTPGTHVFRNICTGPGGTSTAATVSHTVTDPVPTATLSQSTAATAPDTVFTLTWGSTNATACAIDKSVNGGSWMTASGCTSTATSGTCTAAPNTPGTHVFRNICTGPGGTSTAATVSHTVYAVPTATLSQSTASTTPNTVFTLTWGSTNATACAIDKSVNGGSWMTASGCTSTATSGTCTAAPGTVGTHVFRNICTGPGGTSTEATVSHTVYAVPTATLSQSTAATAPDTVFTLTWGSTNATACAIDKSVNGGSWMTASGCTSTATSGTCTAAPNTPGTHVFRNICTGPGGTSTAATVSHTVYAVPTATLSQSTASTTPNTVFTLTWGSTNATACAIDKSVNGGSWMTASGCTSTATSGTCTAAPGTVGTHVFRNICTGPGGTSTAATVSHTVTSP